MKSKDGWRLHQVRWGNPYTTPPNDLPRVLAEARVWGGSSADRIEDLARLMDELGGPGSGWCMAISFEPREVKRWSPERKAATRKRELRKRLERQVPLFADQFEAEALAKSPEYFNGR